jgi:hypothetical protein
VSVELTDALRACHINVTAVNACKAHFPFSHSHSLSEVCVWYIVMPELTVAASSIRSVQGYELAGKGKLQH